MAPTKGKLTAEAVGKASDTNGVLNPTIRKPNRQLIREKTESERAAERTAAWVLQTAAALLAPEPPTRPPPWSSSQQAVGSGIRGHRLDEAFYDAPCEELARRLLGQIVVRRLPDGRRLAGRVVESESYLGGPDAASHSFQGRQTPGNAAMFMKPGTAYVYCIYGMYRCFNISSGGKGSAVLIRALEPLEGLDVMRLNRGAKRKDGGATLQEKDLCNGPSKLCMALDISKELLDQRDLATSDAVWIERGDGAVADADVVVTSRVGIGPSAGEWRTKPLRFYVRGSTFVSSRDRKAEALIPATLSRS